jgi:hypothetical protein
MFRISKYKCVQNLIIAIVFLSFTTAGFSAAMNSARIIPGGKVYIIEGGQVVGEFSKEAPFPEGSLLRCEAQCTVKIDDLLMVAEPQTTFSVAPQEAVNELTVQQGTVYYSLPETSRPLQINTPPGDASIRKFSVTDRELKGYVLVAGGKAEIGVIDGGTMTVETASGEMVITPGEQVTIAPVNPNSAAAAASGGGGSGSVVSDIALGIAGTGVIVAGGYALYSIDWSDNGSDGSPSSP